MTSPKNCEYVVQPMLDSLDLKMLSYATTSQKEETSNTDYEVVMIVEQTGDITCKIELKSMKDLQV